MLGRSRQRLAAFAMDVDRRLQEGPSADARNMEAAIASVPLLQGVLIAGSFSIARNFGSAGVGSSSTADAGCFASGLENEDEDTEFERRARGHLSVWCAPIDSDMVDSSNACGETLIFGEQQPHLHTTSALCPSASDARPTSSSAPAGAGIDEEEAVRRRRGKDWASDEITSNTTTPRLHLISNQQDPVNSIDVWAAPEEDEEEGICDDILETRWQEQTAEEVICDEREAAATLADTEPAVTEPDTRDTDTEAAEAAEGICDDTEAPPVCQHHKEPAPLRGRATEEGGIEVAAVGIQIVEKQREQEQDKEEEEEEEEEAAAASRAAEASTTAYGAKKTASNTPEAVRSLTTPAAQGHGGGGVHAHGGAGRGRVEGEGSEKRQQVRAMIQKVKNSPAALRKQKPPESPAQLGGEEEAVSPAARLTGLVKKAEQDFEREYGPGSWHIGAGDSDDDDDDDDDEDVIV